MLKSTITVLFVITVVVFSIVSASIEDASSDMNTAVYAPKKGHSSIYLNSYIKNCDDASYFIIVVLLSCPPFYKNACVNNNPCNYAIK